MPRKPPAVRKERKVTPRKGSEREAKEKREQERRDLMAVSGADWEATIVEGNVEGPEGELVLVQGREPREWVRQMIREEVEKSDDGPFKLPDFMLM